MFFKEERATKGFVCAVGLISVPLLYYSYYFKSCVVRSLLGYRTIDHDRIPTPIIFITDVCRPAASEKFFRPKLYSWKKSRQVNWKSWIRELNWIENCENCITRCHDQRTADASIYDSYIIRMQYPYIMIPTLYVCSIPILWYLHYTYTVYIYIMIPTLNVYSIHILWYLHYMYTIYMV